MILSSHQTFPFLRVPSTHPQDDIAVAKVDALFYSSSPDLDLLDDEVRRIFGAVGWGTCFGCNK